MKVVINNKFQVYNLKILYVEIYFYFKKRKYYALFINVV